MPAVVLVPLNGWLDGGCASKVHTIAHCSYIIAVDGWVTALEWMHNEDDDSYTFLIGNLMMDHLPLELSRMVKILVTSNLHGFEANNAR